ncbi:MAG TPA: aldehyde dehydrogenase family protein [Opitutaceae bacterium]|nr:aldehyde dehydrogenase family protein [Opitutaceae bacterium]
MAEQSLIPAALENWVNGAFAPALGGATVAKLSPVDGRQLCTLPRSQAADVAAAVAAAKAAQPAWAATPAVTRGMALLRVVRLMEDRADQLARIVAAETGKSVKDARGEVGGAAALGLFYASEGQRLYGRTTTSGMAGRVAMTVRRPIGVAGLIIAANTPIANVAWKVFPALICGNTAVLKAAEDTPATAWFFARLAAEAGLAAGVLNVIHGLGPEAGAALVAHPDVGVVSFTGSTAAGREIQRVGTERFARVSLELGGKNPLVVCDDADLDLAVKWTVLSAFSNAGQRCAAAGRVIVFDAVYEAFRAKLLAATAALKVGPADSDDFGPVINERQLNRMLAQLTAAREAGATVLCGGARLGGPAHAAGCYLAPTILENVAPEAAVSCTELFGPITILYRVPGFAAAIELANRSPYGLTASVHTRDVNRALAFAERVQAGTVTVNGGTYGSEPHMPFGGFKQSGNGTREPGTEALDVYSELQNLYLNGNPGVA